MYNLIGAAQCRHVEMVGAKDWQTFDLKRQVISKLASKFEVFISAYFLPVDDNRNPSIVISNAPIEHLPVEIGETPPNTIKTSDTFEKRSQDFIAELNRQAKLKLFHDLPWSDTEVLYLTLQ